MIKIEMATYQDLPEILAIYRYYVENTAITFEYTTPSLTEFTKRYEKTIEKYPYLIAKDGNEVVGYVYASCLKDRQAYDWSVETSIYVKKGCQKSGIGKKLYSALEKILANQGITNLYACIASPIEEDQYLNTNSIDYHQHIGYQMIGKFHCCGYKFNNWYDMVWMEKIIGKHSNKPEMIKLFKEIKNEIVDLL